MNETPLDTNQTQIKNPDSNSTVEQSKIQRVTSKLNIGNKAVLIIILILIIVAISFIYFLLFKSGTDFLDKN